MTIRLSGARRRIASLTLAATAAAALLGAAPAHAAGTAQDVPQAMAPAGPVKPPAGIIGGRDVADGTYPWMTALLSKGKGRPVDRQFCGGSLIAPDLVLTAAHCVTGVKLKSIEVTVGRTLLSDKKQGALRDLRSIVVHPRYLRGQEAYDLALLELAAPVRGVAAVKLPTPGTDALLRPGAKATVIGWGNTNTEITNYPDRMRGVQVPILSHPECKATYRGYDKSVNVCAGVEGKDSCQGDSGGPLFRVVAGRTYQIGIVSYGEGCAEQGAPGVYASTSSAKLWKTLGESAEGRRVLKHLGR
ncbi:serine protease [Streptomyces sp. NPDC097619]|uniref:S1 family peptidase n=1 Tax=Streptomyces sp. NPDC097619 TaxID=3157228 RepID=UPI00332BCCC8